MANYTFYTDGSCHGNPGPGGWAVVVIAETGEQNILSGGKNNTTNNQMELTALLHALAYINVLNIQNPIIYTDSAYIVNCLTQGWYKKWRQNGWKNAAKQPVANKELWESILVLLEELPTKVSVKKVKGHSDNEHNNLADSIANKEANKYESAI